MMELLFTLTAGKIISMRNLMFVSIDDRPSNVLLGLLFTFSGFTLAFDAIPLQISYRIFEYERAMVGLILIGIGIWLLSQNITGVFLGVPLGIAAFWAATQMSTTNPVGNIWEVGFPFVFYTIGGVAGLRFLPKPFFTDLCLFIVLGIAFWHSFRKITLDMSRN